MQLAYNFTDQVAPFFPKLSTLCQIADSLASRGLANKDIQNQIKQRIEQSEQLTAEQAIALEFITYYEGEGI